MIQLRDSYRLPAISKSSSIVLVYSNNDYIGILDNQMIHLLDHLCFLHILLLVFNVVTPYVSMLFIKQF